MEKCFWLVGIVLFLCLPVQARFPFSFSKPQIKTDYSQTVWDQIMQDQARTDIRRGLGEMSQTRYKDASNSFAKAVIKNAKDPLGYLLLGASLYWEGKVDDAISEYNEALRLDPNNAMAYQLLGIAAGWKGNIQRAQENFLAANRLDPNKADTHMNLGSTYAVQNDLEKALEHFRRATELAPRSPLYHHQLGTLYEALGRDEQAEESFKKSLHYFPAYEDAQLSLGVLYEKMNRPQEALKFYKKAVKTKPGDYVARLRYAFLLLRQGQEKQAREMLEESFSISKFKADGLALNSVYRASGTAPQDFEEQIEKFTDNLSKVASSKPVQIEVEVQYIPPATSHANGKKTSSFEREYQKFRTSNMAQTAGDSRTFRRIFTLPGAEAGERAEQIATFAQGLREVVSQGEKGYQVNLSLQGRTADYATAQTLSQDGVVPKAVYDPRIVGNDMGLWVMGRTWLQFVVEAQDELNDYTCSAGNLCELLKGLAGLAQGNATVAQTFFEQAAKISPMDVLSELGLGTAAVVAADDETARRHYRRVLELSPKNKTAARNLKVLAEE